MLRNAMGGGGGGYGSTQIGDTKVYITQGYRREVGYQVSRKKKRYVILEPPL